MIKSIRNYFIVLFVWVISLSAFAQMSDTQIIEYVKQQTEAGVNQTQIAQNLLARGVTRDQILRLKSKYEKLTSGYNSSKQNSSSDDKRMRVANGEQRLFDDLDESMDSIPNSKIFGHDIFRAKNLSFEPNMNIPTPTDYILGPGDELTIDVYGVSQQSFELKISPDGNVTLPMEGPIYVAGMTARSAQSKIRAKLGEHYQDSEISLSVGQTRTVMVNVLGEVNTPGTYAISAFATVFNALYLAGGVTEIGTLRDVQVSRNGKVITHVDIYDFILNGNLNGNIILQDNDVIRVSPYMNLVEVEGKVRRPMIYEMKDSETLQNLIDYAGGFTGDAYSGKVRVERKSEDGLTVHNVNRRNMVDFHPMDGDVAIVEDIVKRYKNTVTIEGAVFRPGKYKLDNGTTTIKALIDQAGGLKEQAITTRAVLHRMQANRTLETLPVALGDILAGTTADITLRNEDRLTIASTEIIDSLRTLIIEGEVVKPGIYEYSTNETVEDLIIRAGGLLESASVDNIEIARRITNASDNADGKAMSKIFSISLNPDLTLGDNSSNVTLEPYDVVTVHHSPNYKEQNIVVVTGEVNYAGRYALSSKEERLSDIIKRAGGLTKNAYTGGIKLLRQITKEDRDLKRLKLETATTSADSAKALADLQKTTYLVGVDLEKAIKNPGSSFDVVLERGDSVSIPQLTSTVKISGAVLFQNTVSYEEGKSVSYYLEKAGGVSKDGRKSQAYIVYANGNVSRARGHKPEPGCEIVVPVKEKKEFNPQLTSMWLGIGSTMASIAAVIATIIK